jgi:S1-C subfamily serine protease
MRKLAYIFGTVLFLFGCATSNVTNINVSYDPTDYPPKFFSPKDQRPVLYIDTVVDNREFTLLKKTIPERVLGGWKKGRFKEDPKIYSQMEDPVFPDHQNKTTKPPSEIIREALETEVHRFGIKTVKGGGFADGVLKASLEEFIPFIKVKLDLYRTGFDEPVWSGILKGKGENISLFHRSSARARTFAKNFNSTLSNTIKRWYNYPGFKEALIKLAGNVTSPQPVVQQPSVKQQVVSGGTGFLFGSQDYIVTNYHVVKGTSAVKVKFTNGESINAEVVGRDIQNDVAILKLTKSPSFQTREMKFGDSSMVRMGDEVFTIGYPHIGIMGLKPKYTKGVISAVTGIKDNPTVFQTTVPIQPGNSGGPLFNDKGEVVGLTTSSLSLLAIESMGAVPQNVNYAVKSSFVKNTISTIPEALLSNRGIVVVPTDSNSRADFIEAISKNVVLILGKE